MTDIIPLPRSGKPPSLEHLTDALDLAETERVTLLTYRLRRRDFKRTHGLDDEARMFEARDAWAAAYAAWHGASV